VSFVAIIICVASQRVFIFVVYFVIDSVRKLLDTHSYIRPHPSIFFTDCHYHPLVRCYIIYETEQVSLNKLRATTLRLGIVTRKEAHQSLEKLNTLQNFRCSLTAKLHVNISSILCPVSFLQKLNNVDIP
jgi:hypothetical protein